MVVEANAAQEKAWNGESGRTWVTLQPVLDRTYRPIEDLLVDWVAAAAPEPGSRLLDIGCGTGATTLALAQRLGPDVHCTGFDISAPMIDAAAARGRSRPSPPDFVVGDAQTYPFPPAVFDVLVSRFGVMFFDDPVAAFTNLRRATRKGGRLAFVCWRHLDENPFMGTAERIAAPLLPDLPPRLSGQPGPVAFADPQRLQFILDASGWAPSAVTPIDVVCTMPETDLMPYVTQMGPVGRMLPGLDARLRGLVVTALRDAYEEFVDGTEVRYTAACWLVNALAP